MGIEPTRPAWKAGILAIELHPQLSLKYNSTNCLNSQVFFKKKYVLILVDAYNHCGNGNRKVLIAEQWVKLSKNV